MKLLTLTPGTPGLAISHLVEYLKTTNHKLTTITHPVAPLPFRRISTRNNKKFFREPWHLPPVTYFIDMLLTFPLALTRKRYDVAICISTHLALAGILLRKLGLVKKVVYYALDYYPTRYGKNAVVKVGLLERPYRALEKYVVRNSDLLWTITPNMAEGWKQGDYIWKVPIRTVPHCTTHPTVPLDVVNRRNVIWSGNLMRAEEFGFDILVKAWNRIKEQCPDLRLTVTSRTKVNDQYTDFFKRKDVDYIGFVSDFADFRQLICSHLGGISPYAAGTYKKYSDTAGAKLFSSCGIPVVISSQPYTAKLIKDYNAGWVVEPTSESVAEGIIAMVLDKEENRKRATGAYQLALAHEASKVFKEELEYLEAMG